jgi:hypothetical protein
LGHFVMADENLSITGGQIRFDCWDLLLTAGLALAALAAYVYTLAPGLLDADTAELQTQAVMLGYAHPAGSPVYLHLAHLIAWLPVREIPYRVNLFSAIMAAVASGEVYLLGRLLVGRRLTSVAGAAALALSPMFWSQAIIARVYTSGIALMLAVLICLELWRQRGRAGWLFAAACIGGISLGVHITHVLLAPAAILFVAVVQRGWTGTVPIFGQRSEAPARKWDCPLLRWKTNWTAALAGGLTGLAVTLAAYWNIDRTDSPTSYFRSVIYPSRSLPQWHLGPDQLSTFWGRLGLCFWPPQYKVLLFSTSPGATVQKALWYLGDLQNEFPPLWLLLAIAGLWWLGRRNWPMTMLLVLAWAAHFSYDLVYEGFYALYLATYVPVVLLGVAGLAWLGDGLAALGRRLGTVPIFGQRPIAKRWSASARKWDCPHCFSTAAADVLAGVIGLALVVWPLFRPGTWNPEGRRDCWVPPEEDLVRVETSAKLHQAARELVHDLEPGARLFTGWNPLYLYYYVAYVEGQRQDLEFFQDYPHPDYFELADSAVEYVKETAPARPVYFTHVVPKVAELFEMTPVRKGQETLYRVGKCRAK